MARDTRFSGISDPMNVLFVCSKNRWRSPTAEAVFSDWPGVDCLSAGLNHDAESPLTADLASWADVVIVMERDHQTRLKARFKAELSGTRVVCLGIPDKYPFMDAALVKLLQAKVPRYLPPA